MYKQSDSFLEALISLMEMQNCMINGSKENSKKKGVQRIVTSFDKERQLLEACNKIEKPNSG